MRIQKQHFQVQVTNHFCETRLEFWRVSCYSHAYLSCPLICWKSLAFTGGNPQPVQSISEGINMGRDPIHGLDWGQPSVVKQRSSDLTLDIAGWVNQRYATDVIGCMPSWFTWQCSHGTARRRNQRLISYTLIRCPQRREVDTTRKLERRASNESWTITCPTIAHESDGLTHPETVSAGKQWALIVCTHDRWRSLLKVDRVIRCDANVDRTRILIPLFDIHYTPDYRSALMFSVNSMYC